jgi:hypothetical protein
MDWKLAGRCTLAVALLAALPAIAQTLYKLIDKNGKITYSEVAPKNFDGQVIRMDIDPKANTATLPKYEPAPKTEESARRSPSGMGKSIAEQKAEQQGGDRLQQAKDRLEQRRKALADAQNNPLEGDIQLLGKVGGGARPVPSESYQRRLAELERAVKEAEDDLREAEKAR